MSLVSEKPFTREQRNQIHDIVSSAGLPHSDFKFRERTETYSVAFHGREIREVVIFHDPSGYFYCFAHSATYDSLEECALFSPGPSSRRHAEDVYSWDGHLSAVKMWLKCLKKELETPDLWEQAHAVASGQGIQDRTDADNTPFSDADKAQIKIGLDSLREEIGRRFDATSSTLEDVNEQLDELNEAVCRLGRKDWKHNLRSVLLNIAMTLALEPSQIKELFTAAWDAIGSVLQTACDLLP
jgi:hypothetical protein